MLYIIDNPPKSPKCGRLADFCLFLSNFKLTKYQSYPNEGKISGKNGALAEQTSCSVPILLHEIVQITPGKYHLRVGRFKNQLVVGVEVDPPKLLEVLPCLQHAITLQESKHFPNHGKNGFPFSSTFSLKEELGQESNICIQGDVFVHELLTARHQIPKSVASSSQMFLPGGQDFNQEAFSPRDFYDHVHVPSKNLDTSLIDLSGLDCQLYPFQRRAVHWLLNREGMEPQAHGSLVQKRRIKEDSLPISFRKALDANGNPFYVSNLFGMVTKSLARYSAPERTIKGGILAEEMGLGKTVELIALISLHRRPVLHGNMDGNLRSSGSTLIITPPSILGQWEDEIRTHAPNLKVLHYTGCRNAELVEDDEPLMAKLLEQDIVLTTYSVLSSEIHYAGDAPNRNLRYQKRFEARKSPLMKIDWWRVCLDEAQMVESGVSNAAKVARLVPRQNAWAISGTPLKKNVADLYGLLLFLQFEPFCESSSVWSRLINGYKPVLQELLETIAIRHTKDEIREELRLPAQKRIVITVPFTAVEEQHYSQMFQRMCEECQLDLEGGPLSKEWDPESPTMVERMRSWLTRLRQTVLHPEIGVANRRALGANGPLRSVAEVLEVMIDQNDASLRTEERTLLMSQARRGQVFENAKQSKDALEIWESALKRSTTCVEESRSQLQAEIRKQHLAREGSQTSNDEDHGANERNARLGASRLRLRSALEVHHILYFFIGNAYYQLANIAKESTPESKAVKDLEAKEEESYEIAKRLRQEMLTEVLGKVDRLISLIQTRARDQHFVQIPEMIPPEDEGGIESRKFLTKLDGLYGALNEQANKIDEWRERMIQLLKNRLVDEDEGIELQGDEYETSTKQQDEIYVLMEGLRAVISDRHDTLTGQRNFLIDHDMKRALKLAEEGEGASPELLNRILMERDKLKPDVETLGSVRGIIAELRALCGNLQNQEDGGSTRARVELAFASKILRAVQTASSQQMKAKESLEKELDIFRDTMNMRLEYYRQLQQISDMVAPFEEENIGKPANHTVVQRMLKAESACEDSIAKFKAKSRYLLHLRSESSGASTERLCIICQTGFENGALTVCGHQFCLDCLRMWYSTHRTCPICKRTLRSNEFHAVTYKPQELIIQEESGPSSPQAEKQSKDLTAIYSAVDTSVLDQIKNIDLDGSYGTKIDILARHILWLREHDGGSKSIIFSQYKEFLDILARAFSQFKIGFSSIDRKAGIDRFKKDPSVEVFLLHAKAHSSGLNLVNATHVFLCEPLINTALELQAIARVHRIGQTRPTTVWMYLITDTVEEAIYDISVSRRMAHISSVNNHKKNGAGKAKSRNGTKVEESLLDAANSIELEDATLATILTKGLSGGELVEKDDLWDCLFSKRGRSGTRLNGDATGEVGRFLRAEAADNRATSAVAGPSS